MTEQSDQAKADRTQFKHNTPRADYPTQFGPLTFPGQDND